jgi:tetratricopeptide (TPR) repeat protein
MLRHELPREGLEPLEGDAIFALFVHLMHGLAAERPLVWILEDLQFAGPDSRRIILSLARALVGHRVLLVGTTRPGLPESELGLLAGLDGSERLRLGRLSPREVIELARDAFRSESLADELGARIAYKSDGVPLFIIEMIRGLEEGGLVSRQSDGTYVQTEAIGEIEVPSAVRSLVEARLQALSEEDRRLLDLAAVHGHEFDPGLLARIRSVPRMVVLEQLASLERRTGIVCGEGLGYRFDQHQIQEVVYADLHAALRSDYHAALAEAFLAREEPSGVDPESLPGEKAFFVAQHHLRGSDPAAALPFLVPALIHLGRFYRFDASLELAHLALETPGLLPDVERLSVLLRAAEAQSVLGRRPEEWALLEEARDLSDALGEQVRRARVRSSIGFHLFRVARYEEARASLEEAHEISQRSGERGEQGVAARGLGAVYWALGRQAEARAYREEALALARETGDRNAEALATGNLGNMCLYLDRYEEAREHYERELSIARETGNRREEGMALGGLGLVSVKTGRLKEACERYEESIAIARELGDRQSEAAGTANLSNVLITLGRLGEAKSYRERSLAIAREIGERSFEGIALSSLGSLYTKLGDRRRAAELLREARELNEEIRNLRALPETLKGQGELAQVAGDLPSAIGLIEMALSIEEEVSHPKGVGTSHVLLARVLAECGRLDESEIHAREALALGEELGAPDLIALSACLLATLPGGSPEDAAKRVIEIEEQLGAMDRLEARYHLWRATSDEEHLEAAHDLLLRIRSGSPAEYRDTMLEHVPLYRQVRTAWRKERASPNS